MPSLASNMFPSCPKEGNGTRGLVIPAYKDYSIPFKEYAFSNHSDIVQRLESLAEEQTKQYNRGDGITSMLETNSACGRYSSLLIEEGKAIAINFAEPKYFCYGNYANKSFEHNVYATVLSKEMDGSVSYQSCTYDTSSELIKQLREQADSSQAFSCSS